MSAVQLSRAALAAPAAPTRIIHLGLGHFFRAHQAWYTSRATDAEDWGIAAFTGRSPRMSEKLASQDGLYCLVVRDADGDRVEVVTSVTEAHAGDAIDRLEQLAADPVVAVITLTVTESGYRLRSDGTPDLDDDVLASDLRALRAGDGAPVSALGRLVCALNARRAAAGGPIAVVSCDNIPDNGRFVRAGTIGFAAELDTGLAEWIDRDVSFVSTSVDRITPHVQVEAATLIDAGWIDSAPVVTEPFSDWVLQGDFPAGRPAWESAGARFVDDIEPWENRKLWLLNGAHSILTFAGQLRGHETVAEAIADPECRALVDTFWDDAVQCLPEGIEHVGYRDQLIDRFSNPRIVHRLAQIAPESTVKVQYRFASVAERTLVAGREPQGTTRAFALWIEWVLAGRPAVDARADELAVAAASDDPVRSLLALISPSLAAQDGFLTVLRSAVGRNTPVTTD